MLPYKVPENMEEAVAPVRNPRELESLPTRVKEVFVLFDDDSSGFLSTDELEKLLRKLSGFTNDEIAAFCSDIDRSKDGKVSYRELVDWIRRGGGRSGELVAKAIIRETNKRAVRIQAAFDRYDDSGDGSLDLAELTQVLRTLGAFTNHEIKNVLADLDSNGDGDISFPEFVDWVRRGTGKKELIKAKCILAPSDSDGIEAVFYNFCGPGFSDIDGKRFLKMLKDAKLLNTALNQTSVDLIFSDNRIKSKYERRIEFPAFELALEMVAEKRGSSLEDVRMAIMQCTHPILTGTKADYVRYHDDIDKTTKDAVAAAHGEASCRLSVMRRKELKKQKTPGQLPLVEVPEDWRNMKVDNAELFKTFGMGNPAGRSLHRLYAPHTPPRPLTESVSSNASWPSATKNLDTYVAVNAVGVCKFGIRFRRSMYLPDICNDPPAVLPWGSSIKGDLVASCWLKVGKHFLPTLVNGVQVMQRWTGPGPPPNPYSPSLGRTCSLPVLKTTEKAVILRGLPFAV